MKGPYMKGSAYDPIGHILCLSKYNSIVTYVQVYLIFIDIYRLNIYLLISNNK